MPLLVMSVTTADIPRIIAIERDAYASSPFQSILFPGPFPSAASNRAQELAVQLHEDGKSTWSKIVDTDVAPSSSGHHDLGTDDNKKTELMQTRSHDFDASQSVAFANWYIHDPTSESSPKRTYGKGCNTEACELLFGGLVKHRERILANEGTCVYIQTLLVDPAHQRRGLGGMLLDAIKSEADNKGLRIHLEASPEGRGLYLKNGFHDIECHEVDMAKWGGGIHRSWAMRWPGGEAISK